MLCNTIFRIHLLNVRLYKLHHLLGINTIRSYANILSYNVTYILKVVSINLSNGTHTRRSINIGRIFIALIENWKRKISTYLFRIFKLYSSRHSIQNESTLYVREKSDMKCHYMNNNQIESFSFILSNCLNRAPITRESRRKKHKNKITQKY